MRDFSKVNAANVLLVQEIGFVTTGTYEIVESSIYSM